MNSLSKVSASWTEITEDSEGQRVDNYLLKMLKGVPKSYIYRVLRSGEVRVNSGRVRADHRLHAGDKVRIPPVRTSVPLGRKVNTTRAQDVIAAHIIFEDDELMVINKPAGMAVHGGSGISLGVIEHLRAERPAESFLELVHRLDRETSGCLLIAKKRRALLEMHAALRDGNVDKRYVALVKGEWRAPQLSAKIPLHKYLTAEGERRVAVNEQGQYAHTLLRLRQAWPECSLLEAQIMTGRTHQIRVHLAHLGFPIAGDDKYGDFGWNKELTRRGCKRMFLHAESLSLTRPEAAAPLRIKAPIPQALQEFIVGLGAPVADYVST
jgi:23S rRNA pseudouridine955/2504/2580 synthase